MPSNINIELRANIQVAISISKNLKTQMIQPKAYVITSKLVRKESVLEYSGFNGETVISKIKTSDPLISDNYNKIKQSIENSSDTEDVNEFNANAFIFKAKYINTSDEEIPLVFITSRAPFKNFKKNRAFTFHKNSYIPFEKELLQLVPYFDLIVANDTLYLFNLGGEGVLNLEKSYKIKCASHLESIGSCDIISDFDHFKAFALSGHTPRKFLTYEQNKLDYLSNNLSNRMSVSTTFDIPIDTTTGKFDTSNNKSAEKLVKFLCNKAKIDPVNSDPCEVSSSIDWH